MTRTRHLIARTALLALAVALAATPAQAATAISGRLADGALPSKPTGRSVVRAVSPRTTLIASAERAGFDGRYRLTVDPGVFTVLANVVRRDRAERRAIAATVRVRKGRTVKVRVSLKRKRPVRPARRASAHATTALRAAGDGNGPIIAVKWFTGTGPWAVLGHGMADMLLTDLVEAGDRQCGARFVEWNHRDLLQAELDLQEKYKEYFDPSTVVRQRWLSPEIFVQGSVTTTNDTVAWSVQLVDAKTGKVLGGDTASVAGEQFFEAEQQVARRLLDQLCPRRYEATLDLATDSRWPALSASGTMRSVVTATGSGTPAATWTGTGSLQYTGVTWASGVEGCTYATEGSPISPWRIDIASQPNGTISVTWQPQGDTYVTGIATCTVGGVTTSVGNQPGPRLQDPTPLTFTLPATGGAQAIAGGLDVGGSGWFHRGSLTLRRLEGSG